MGEVAKAAGGFAGRWTGGLTIMAMPQLRSAGFEASIFRNLNTPEDYEGAIRGNSGTHS